MPILDSSVFVCHCMFSLSFTSMSCDLEGRYPSLTNDSARVKNTYFEVMFGFGKFSVEQEQHKSLSVQI